MAGPILTSLHGRRIGLDAKNRLVVGDVNRTLFNMPYLAYANTAASTAVSNTITETAFDTSYSIPANLLQAGNVIKVRYQGIATSTNATDTLLIKAYVNSTAVLTGTATDVANNDLFAGDFEVFIRTVGATGTFVAAGIHTEAPAASGTATMDRLENTASTTVDTTAAVVLSVKATWSVASASNSCRMDLFRVEIW